MRKTREDARADGTPVETAAYHHGDLRRSLIDAALALVAETGNWAFSLREVARRAGVSHNAPYNHFADRNGLRDAVAAAGFEALRARMEAEAAHVASAADALAAIGRAYVRFGVANPAHYRLMFGASPKRGSDADATLSASVATEAGAAKSVLAAIVGRGVADGSFAVPGLTGAAAAEVLVLTAWALVHGLTMLALDGLTIDGLAIDGLAIDGPASDGLAGGGAAGMPDAVARVLLDGVRAR